MQTSAVRNGIPIESYHPTYLAHSQVNPYYQPYSASYLAPPQAAYLQSGYPLHTSGVMASGGAVGVPASVGLPSKSVAGVLGQGGLYSHIQGLKEPRESERRVTYHPYVRTYIDYEQRVVLVPVQKVKINYYEKIYETNYIAQAVEEVITQTVPVEKEYMKLQYIPVEQKIVHFPKEEKLPVAGNQVIRTIYVDSNNQQIASPRDMASSGSKQIEQQTILQVQQNLQSQIQQNQQYKETVIMSQAPAFRVITTNSQGQQQQQIEQLQSGQSIQQLQQIHQQVQGQQVQQQTQPTEPTITINNQPEEKKNSLGESHIKEIFVSEAQDESKL